VVVHKELALPNAQAQQTYPETQPPAMHKFAGDSIRESKQREAEGAYYIMYVLPEHPSPTTTIFRFFSA
jgi:hypothetical protein